MFKNISTLVNYIFEESFKMKKTILLIALSLLSTMIFTACGSVSQTETSIESGTSALSEASENAVLNDLANTKWKLTNGTAGNPVNGNIITGEDLTDAINLTLEFREDGKVIFTSNNNNPKEYTYSYDYTKKDECCISIVGEYNNAISAIVENDTMTFYIFNTTMIFTKQ